MPKDGKCNFLHIAAFHLSKIISHFGISSDYNIRNTVDASPFVLIVYPLRQNWKKFHALISLRKHMVTSHTLGNIGGKCSGMANKLQWPQWTTVSPIRAKMMLVLEMETFSSRQGRLNGNYGLCIPRRSPLSMERISTCQKNNCTLRPPSLRPLQPPLDE